MNFGNSFNHATSLSPIFGGLEIGSFGKPHEPELKTPQNWLLPDLDRESAERRRRREGARQPSAYRAPKLPDEAEGKVVEEEISDIGDLQKTQSIGQAVITLLFGVGLGWIKLKTNPSLKPVTAELKAVVAEEAGEEHPITPFAFTTAMIVLGVAFNEIDVSVPMPAIAPDGSGGLRIEWARGDRNVLVAISSSANRRSFVYHMVDDVSELDRLSGAKLAARLRQVIL